MPAEMVSASRLSVRGTQREAVSAFGNLAVLVVVSFISPVMGLAFSLIVFLGELSRWNAVACAVSFGVAAALASYSIEYNHAVDMTRWMSECAYYAGKPISSIFTSINQDHTSLLVWNIWCWIVGNIGDLQLLQASAAFFGYGMIAWLFMDACVSESMSRAAFLAVFVFVLLVVPAQTIVGNVRSTLASVMCCIAFYIRTQKEPAITVLSLTIIVAACLIHKSMVIALGIWLLQPLISNNPKKMALLFGVGIYVVISVSNYILSIGLFSGVPFLEEVLSLASFYTEGTEWDQAQASNPMQIANHVIRVVLMLLLLIRVGATGGKKKLWPLMLVGAVSVLSMEVTLVNVGLRFQYIPLLIGALMLLNHSGEDRALRLKWPLLVDFTLMVLAIIVAAISLRDFIPSFNYLEVACAAVWFPAAML